MTRRCSAHKRCYRPTITRIALAVEALVAAGLSSAGDARRDRRLSVVCRRLPLLPLQNHEAILLFKILFYHDDDAAKPQFVLVFDPSEKLSSDDDPSKHVIAPIPNSDIWSRFVLDTPGNGSTDPATNRYGLLLRSNGVDERKDSMPDPKEDPTKRRFLDVPVEGFGAAILAGYGWSEGKGIGRNKKEDPEIFEYKRRSGTRRRRQGFGEGDRDC